MAAGRAEAPGLGPRAGTSRTRGLWVRARASREGRPRGQRRPKCVRGAQARSEGRGAEGVGLAPPVACAVGPKNCCALVVLGGD